MTTLELGGPARWYTEVSDDGSLIEALTWARDRGLPVIVLGGGSNVVVADSGYVGLVIRPRLMGVRVEDFGGDQVNVTAAAGEDWDDLVTWTVGQRMAGFECLAGIPGTVGGTPIQNVGAYGQEVGERIVSVRVFDREALEVRELDSEECGFSYRSSLFRRSPARFVVLDVTFRLVRGGEPTIVYPELRRTVERQVRETTLDSVRGTVLELRRSKGMVLDPDDANRRSAGSFFVNPVISEIELELLIDRAAPLEVPRFVATPGRFKVPAAWLIEQAGFHNGLRRGPVGISSRHCLALVHHGGGRTEDLLALAREIRDAVGTRFGVVLRSEPVMVGFGEVDPL